MKSSVKAWREEVIIPTYEIGKPEKVPVFSEKRIYQGSSGVVYPHPVVETISDEKRDKTYIGLFLENEYIKLMILPEIGGRVQMAFIHSTKFGCNIMPEIGGRVQMAWDKVQNRHFIYYNQVIKPALVGLTGPWISGGIEFNWPQHHRPSTFEPVDFAIVENNDGSKTIWVNEIELMFRTKGMAGFTLYPGKAYFEITGRLYNRTPFPQTFLWWANPAVKVNEHYQSVFPPDVHAVFDHGRRDVSTFPIAKGTYYKIDYSPGTDISRYKNIPVPTSYMAYQSKYDFIGGYEHDTNAGVLHIADHHISPGKKQWTWGNFDFGQAWDRNLTDEDGPYIEIMTGMFTDNQPDFSWIQPQEEKNFTQYFLPYSKIGLVKNATKEALINLEIEGKLIHVKVFVTSGYQNLKIIIRNGENVLFETMADLAPDKVYENEIQKLVKESDLYAEVLDETGKLLVSYHPDESGQKEIPLAAQPAKAPKDIESTELLYINGLHIEQYRHATYSATDYYEEALKRDEGDIRNNNALGLWLLRRGQFAKSEKYFRKAIERLTLRNPNPYNSEPYYNLGWSLKMQGKSEEAFDAFYKCTWNDTWQHAGFFNLARLASKKGNFEEAIKFINLSLVKNWSSHSVRHLKTILLRKVGNIDEALSLISDSLIEDPFNFGCRFEKYILLKNLNKSESSVILDELFSLMRSSATNFIEYALDYAQAGFYKEAIEFLKVSDKNKRVVNPLIYYYLGYFSNKLNLKQDAVNYYKKAAQLKPDYCFPHRIEEILVLQDVLKENPSDAKASYYLGNLWYDKRQYNEAFECWELSASIDPSFSVVYRNLSLAFHNKKNKTPKALELMEKAFSLDKTNSRIFMELDQLNRIVNKPDAERLSILNKNMKLVLERDDLYLEYISLLNNKGNYDEALTMLANRKFHPWEGGEGKVVKQYLIANIEQAKIAILEKKFDHALELLAKTEKYPHNLGEGKLFGVQENDIHFLQGMALEGLNKHKEAIDFYKKATIGISEPVQAIFYNDPQPDKIFYQGLAWLKLGETKKAQEIFSRLINFGEGHKNDTIKIDYFAVSLPDLLVFDQDLNLKNKIHCTYLMGLGNLGLTKYTQALDYFNQVMKLDNYHQGAIIHANMINFMESVLLKAENISK